MLDPLNPVVDQVAINVAWLGSELGRREITAFRLAGGRYCWDPAYGGWIRDHIDFPRLGHTVTFADVEKERWWSSKRTGEVSAKFPASILTGAADGDELIAVCLTVIDRVLRRYAEVAGVPAPPAPPTVASPVPETYVESLYGPEWDFLNDDESWELD